MPAYIIVEIDVVDPVGYEDYKKLAGATVEKYGGKYIVRGGKTEVLEGEWKQTWSWSKGIQHHSPSLAITLRGSSSRKGDRCSRDRRSRREQLAFHKKFKDCFCRRSFANLAFPMRLLLEIVIVAGLIYVGWNRPFKEWAAHGSAMATSRIHAPAWEDHSATPTSPPARRIPR